jgi:predicted Zn-dependent protease
MFGGKAQEMMGTPTPGVHIMKFGLVATLIAPVLLLNSLVCFAQNSQPDDKLLTGKAQHEYAAKKLAEAERDFRELTLRHPSSVYMQIYLGQTLFEQQKFAESLRPFAKALDLERSGNKLTSDQHRILVDELVMAYGMSGDLKKARALLDDAIQQDPEYPLNYYNLACAFAEEGDKSRALANLSLAFEHKDNVLKGEKMPDPRADSSFQKYVRDDDFIVLMKKLGYQ